MTESTTNGTSGGQEPDNGTDDFASAFAEFSAPAGDPPADTAGSDPAATGEGQEGTAEVQPASDGGSDAGKITTGDADASAPPVEAPDDIWANAPDALRSAYQAERERAQRAEHRIASDNGRVATLTRQLEQARRGNATGGGTNQTETPDGLKDLLESDKIKGFREEYPEVAGPILDLITAQQAKIDRLTGSVEQVDQERADRAIGEQEQSYIAAHPDWQDFTPGGRHSAAFGEWLGQQPRYVIEAVQRNAGDIVDAQEAADVLSRFKASSGLAPKQPDPPPSPQPDARRQKQLAAGADVRTKGPAVTSGVPDDFSAAFASFAAKKDARRT